MNRKRVITLKVKQVEETKFEKTLNDIGFYDQDHNPTEQEKDCAELLFNLGYFEK